MKKHKPVFSFPVEGLEPRTVLSKPAPIEKFSQPVFYFNDVSAGLSGGSGTSQVQYLIIRNAGQLPLRFNSKGLRFMGPDAADFKFTGKSVPATIEPGKTRTVPIAFNATRVGIETAMLLAVSNDTKHHSVSIGMRGLGTKGTGGLNEPSFQRILDLYQIPIKVGEPNPDQTAFPVPPSTPNDEVTMQTLVKADASKPVGLNLLAVFANSKSPATTFGWYKQNNTGSATNVSDVPIEDAQSVHPRVDGSRYGTTSFDPGSNEFGIYTVFPAFGARRAYSQDGLNTWDGVTSHRKKVRFYPMKNADGTTVPNSFIFATEDYDKAFDSNDVIGVLSNVKAGPNASTNVTAPPPPVSSGGGTGSISNIPNLSVLNVDVLPSNSRMVFNRITNLDELRPNVTHDIGTLQITNKGSSDMVIDSISSEDNANFTIVSGGGSGITLAPKQTRIISVQFKGDDSANSIIKIYNSNLNIVSGGKTDTIVLAGLWQAYSEQTPATPHHIYDEPSLAQVVNSVFGYRSVIFNDGQTTRHGGLIELGVHGDRTPVGSEVMSDYWTSANGGSVKVRQLAAVHRQNNFDAAGEASTAASGIRWFYEGASTSTTKIFVHNIDEGQCMLPHISNSLTRAAESSFSPEPGRPFAFKVDHQFSVDSLNDPDIDPATLQPWPEPTGHAFRFYPLVDANGKTIANTYIVAQDYTALSYSNYDYNDNIYLISNIAPVGATAQAASAKNAAPADLWSNVAIEQSRTNNVLSATDSGVL